MSKCYKVMTAVGTRPEIIKLSRIIQELDRFTNHQFVHTGQNYDYELSEIFYKDLNLRQPDFYLDAAGNNSAETISQVILKADQIFEKEQPDAVVFYGDTNSCLAAISAKRRKIPIFHLEAGNRCFDQRVPEELNRKIIDHISDINMPLTEHARRHLINEGIRADTIIKIGSTMQEILQSHRSAIEGSQVLHQLNLTKNQYFLVSSHREENVDSPVRFESFVKSLNALADKYQQPIIVSTHPRTRQRLDVFSSKNANALHPLIQWLKPLGFHDYNHLQLYASCVISDSGTLTEEASILNLPAVMIRQTHERPEGMDAGVSIMADFSPDKLLQAVHIIQSQHAYQGYKYSRIEDYQEESVSTKVTRAIISYIDYINRTVWHKSSSESHRQSA
ncbi:UDP-N-acetyl-L-fucosamine synthase [Planctomycetales bacterium 10988]|nr:UDP-N-acetyl-L-fucosamine synthase [Planctomycetales bacterium 10988]